MNALIVYDSQYGNTEKIAQVIASSIKGKSKLLHVKNADISDLKDIDLLVIGSPTQGGRPTSAVGDFLNSITSNSLKQVKAASFDTRFSEGDVGKGLRLLMKVIGYAAPKMAKELKKKKAILILPPEGFIVEGKEGPLKKGECERAKSWIKKFNNKYL